MSARDELVAMAFAHTSVVNVLCADLAGTRALLAEALRVIAELRERETA